MREAFAMVSCCAMRMTVIMAILCAGLGVVFPRSAVAARAVASAEQIEKL